MDSQGLFLGPKSLKSVPSVSISKFSKPGLIWIVKSMVADFPAAAGFIGSCGGDHGCFALSGNRSNFREIASAAAFVFTAIAVIFSSFMLCVNPTTQIADMGCP